MFTPNLSGVWECVAERCQFNPSRYQVMAKMSAKQCMAFAVSHSVLHMAKTLGQLAAEPEKVDRNGVMDEEAVKEGLVKMFINVVALASAMGMTEHQLAEAVPRLMRK